MTSDLSLKVPSARKGVAVPVIKTAHPNPGGGVSVVCRGRRVRTELEDSVVSPVAVEARGGCVCVCV